ncbi:unnamed protein product [Mycena citricolor]|uniref:General negative regulator of transcription subunit n=1 Tax=Mycena citricolor TaxID=2018698 RepID=A0AAD2JUG1_9AGAR|nr:unnamed protein product [Mycena citricolor]
MAARKLQTEIDRTLKKVSEGVELFESIYDKMQASTNQPQKEKLELELKTQIKKLQRLRDQIKNWLTSNDIKDKSQLLENRKLIETQMERFKATEKEMKTKAFSKEGLIQAAKLDPKEQEKEDTIAWCQSQVEELQMQVEQAEAEIETLQVTGKKKNKSGSAASRLDELETLNERRKFHIGRLEIILRLLNNGSLSADKVLSLKEDVQYYVETNTEEGVGEDDGIYDDLNLDEEEEQFGIAAEDDESDDSDEASEDLPPPRPLPKKIDEESAANSKSPILKKAAVTLQLRKSSIDGISNCRSGCSKLIDISYTIQTSTAPKFCATTYVKYFESWPAFGTGTGTGTSASTNKTGHVASRAVFRCRGWRKQCACFYFLPTCTPSTCCHVAFRWAISSKSAHRHSAVVTQSDSSFRDKSDAVIVCLRLSSAGFLVSCAVGRRAKLSRGPAATSSPPRPRNDSPSRADTHSPSPPSSAAIPRQSTPQFPPGVKMSQSEQSVGTAPSRTSAGAFPGSLSDLVVSFEAVKQKAAVRMSNLDQVHKILQGGYSNVPQPQDTEKAKYYVPRNPFTTQAYYPQSPHPLLSTAAIFSQLDVETLFYVFYYLPGTYQQYLAAKELKRQSWRFHVKYLTWFQRHSEPQAITEEYEQGIYVYFDWEGSWCQRKKSDFRFEYRYLSED